MNLADARVVLRPRGRGELLDLAARWCFGADRSLYLRLAAAVLLPSLLLCAAARLGAQWAWPGVWGLALALTTVGQGVFTVATSRALFERNVSAASVLRQFFGRLPAYLGALVVTRAILAVSAVTVVLLPTAWARVSLVHEACLLEGGSPGMATRRAWELGRHRRPELVILLGGMGLSVVAAVIAAELLGHGLVGFVLQLGEPLGTLTEGGSVYALVGFHAVIPYVAVARFLGYVDARTRGDGWDIQVRFMALAHRDSTPRRTT